MESIPFSFLLSIVEKFINIFRKKYYIEEKLTMDNVEFNYYRHTPFDIQEIYSYKVSSVPKKDPVVSRRTLNIRIVNKTDKPKKIIGVKFFSDKKPIELDPVIDGNFPFILEPHIGDFNISIIIDQLRAYSYAMKKEFNNQLASLFFFTNLTVEFDTVEFIFSDGKSKRYKISSKMISEIEKIINIYPKIHEKLKPKTKCSVENCSNDPDYLILLYDHYSNGNIFVEQDYTCPFLCEEHMQENERGIGNKGIGDLRYPRSVNYYPYSNQNCAQGYTRYFPINYIKE